MSLIDLLIGSTRRTNDVFTSAGLERSKSRLPSVYYALWIANMFPRDKETNDLPYKYEEEFNFVFAS